MTPQSFEVTVWTVSHKSANLVAGMIASLPDFVTRIVIAENSGSIAERAQLEEIRARDPRVAPILPLPNHGFGHGMNSIARSESGRPNDIIWLLNPDTEVLFASPNELSAQLLENDPAIISPLIVGDVDSHAIWFDGGHVDLRSGRCTHVGFGERARHDHGTVLTNYVTGAAPMMRREVFTALSGFDERLFLYWEDVELSLRAASLGVNLLVSGAVRVLHAEGGSADVPRGATYRYFMARNRVWVCWASGDYSPWVRGVGETLREVLRSLRGGPSGRFARAFATLKGSVSGYARARAYSQGPRRGLVDANPLV